MATRRPVNRITPRKRPAGAGNDTANESTTGAGTTVRASTDEATGDTFTAAASAGSTAQASTAEAPADTFTAAATEISSTKADVTLGGDTVVGGSSLTERLPGRLRTIRSRPRATTAAGTTGSDSGVSGQVPVPSAGARRFLGAALSGRGSIVVAIAAAVLTAFAVLAAFRPGVPGAGNRAYADPAATAEVTAAARNALQTVYSYDSKTVGGYKDAVHKVVTGKMRTDFDSFADTTVSAIQQAQSTATATADPIGVTMLTGDHAELLVNLVVSATKDGVPQETASGPIVLRMQRSSGQWLASEIADR